MGVPRGKEDSWGLRHGRDVGGGDESRSGQRTAYRQPSPERPGEHIASSVSSRSISGRGYRGGGVFGRRAFRGDGQGEILDPGVPGQFGVVSQRLPRLGRTDLGKELVHVLEAEMGRVHQQYDPRAAEAIALRGRGGRPGRGEVNGQQQRGCRSEGGGLPIGRTWHARWKWAATVQLASGGLRPRCGRAATAETPGGCRELRCASTRSGALVHSMGVCRDIGGPHVILKRRLCVSVGQGAKGHEADHIPAASARARVSFGSETPAI